MEIAPGDVVSMPRGYEAVVLRVVDRTLVVLFIVCARGPRRRSDVSIPPMGFLRPHSPVVRCDSAALAGIATARRLGRLESADLTRISAAFLKERSVRAAEDRLHYMPRRSTVEIVPPIHQAAA